MNTTFCDVERLLSEEKAGRHLLSEAKQKLSKPQLGWLLTQTVNHVGWLLVENSGS